MTFRLASAVSEPRRSNDPYATAGAAEDQRMLEAPAWSENWCDFPTTTPVCRAANCASRGPDRDAKKCAGSKPQPPATRSQSPGAPARDLVHELYIRLSRSTTKQCEAYIRAVLKVPLSCGSSTLAATRTAERTLTSQFAPQPWP